MQCKAVWWFQIFVFLLYFAFVYFQSCFIFSLSFLPSPLTIMKPMRQEDMRDLIAPLAQQHQWHSKLFGVKKNAADQTALLHAAGGNVSGNSDDQKQDATSSSSSSSASSASNSSSSAFFSADEAAVDLASMLSLSSSSSSSTHALRTEPSGIGLSVHQLSALLLGSGLLIEAQVWFFLSFCPMRELTSMS
jgi:hypothetical protein